MNLFEPLDLGSTRIRPRPPGEMAMVELLHRHGVDGVVLVDYLVPSGRSSHDAETMLAPRILEPGHRFLFEAVNETAPRWIRIGDGGRTKREMTA